MKHESLIELLNAAKLPAANTTYDGINQGLDIAIALVRRDGAGDVAPSSTESAVDWARWRTEHPAVTFEKCFHAGAQSARQMLFSMLDEPDMIEAIWRAMTGYTGTPIEQVPAGIREYGDGKAKAAIAAIKERMRT